MANEQQTSNYERALKMLAAANGLPDIHMSVEYGEVPAEIFLMQEVHHSSFKEKEKVQILPVTDPQEEYKLDIMEGNVAEKREEEKERARAQQLKKKRDNLLQQSFTDEELRLMEEY